jgi:HK97 gp10 family phage protein
MGVRVVPVPGAAELVPTQPILWYLATQVMADAKRIVPVRTGRLRASIGTGHIDGNSAVVQASAPYAGYVELGTRYMRAQPYLRPALYKFRSPA